jgi:hypothetical protein
VVFKVQGAVSDSVTSGTVKCPNNAFSTPENPIKAGEEEKQAPEQAPEQELKEERQEEQEEQEEAAAAEDEDEDEDAAVAAAEEEGDQSLVGLRRVRSRSPSRPAPGMTASPIRLLQRLRLIFCFWSRGLLALVLLRCLECTVPMLLVFRNAISE